jgi:ClpP class serine protease
MACGGCSIDSVQHALDFAMVDPTIKRVLLDVSSPGGTVAGVAETAAAIHAASQTKKVYAATDSQMASAAYWLASQAGAGVFVTSTAMAGNIGVYSARLDRSVAMEKAGERVELFTSGKYKGAGALGAPLTDDQRAEVQALVDQLFGMFSKAVQSARAGVAKGSMQGQTFIGVNAVKAGLADGQISSVMALARRLS